MNKQDNRLGGTAFKAVYLRGLLFVVLVLPATGWAAEVEQSSPFTLPETLSQTNPGRPATAQELDSPFSLPEATATAPQQQEPPPDSPFALPETTNAQVPGSAADLQRRAGAEDLFNRGTELARQGKYEEAGKTLRQVLEIDPRHVRAMNNIGLVLRRLDKNEEALRVYRQAIEADKTYALTYKNMGILLDQMNDLKGALAAYEAYLRVMPHAPDAKTIKKRCDWLTAEGSKQAAKAGKGEK